MQAVASQVVLAMMAFTAGIPASCLPLPTMSRDTAKYQDALRILES